MRLSQITTRNQVICQLLLAVLSPVLLTPSLSLCFCSDGYEVCTDCRCSTKNTDDYLLSKNNSSCVSFTSAETANGCCHKNTEREKISVPFQKNIDENFGTTCTCLKIDISFVSANCVLNEKEQNQTNGTWWLTQVLSSVVLFFQTAEMPNHFTRFSFPALTWLLPVRLHLFQSVLLI
jgi:hypothetical protein